MRAAPLLLFCSTAIFAASTPSWAGNPSRTPVNYWKSREGALAQAPARHHCPWHLLAATSEVDWWPPNGPRFGKDSDARCRRWPISRN